MSEEQLNTEAKTPNPVAKPVSQPPKKTVRVSVKIAGTRKSGFRFNCGGIEQYQLDVTREFTHEQAKRIADLVMELVSQREFTYEQAKPVADLVMELVSQKEGGQK